MAIIFEDVYTQLPLFLSKLSKDNLKLAYIEIDSINEESDLNNDNEKELMKIEASIGCSIKNQYQPSKENILKIIETFDTLEKLISKRKLMKLDICRKICVYQMKYSTPNSLLNYSNF
ncbi:hypothetical protein H8356DRAFT_1324735 [Neocallimastix lanati (nom. inval.)]|nr:hypothetical protein H8356DRAFT_1324735 [Neocallimastix sp. JGI-2020a]